MLGGARWSAMLGGAKGTRTHVCPRPWTYSALAVFYIRKEKKNEKKII